MSDLSPDLQRLVFAGKHASKPTAADFARVQSALATRLGDVFVSSGDLAPVTGSRGLLRATSGKLIGLTVVGLALVVGGLALYASRQRNFEEVGVTTVAVASVPTPTVVDPPQAVGSPVPVASFSNPAVSESKRAPGVLGAREPARARDSLAEEVALLTRAESELHRGRTAKALELLNEHDRRFPGGSLAEERMAARVQALCTLGRMNEGSAQLAKLKPGSLHTEGARKACAAPPTTKAK